MKTTTLTLEELSDATGVPVRTIRYYITEGLLPGPGGRGKGAVYTAEHLSRLRLIRSLAEQRVPLTEIRERATRLTLPEVNSLLAEQNAKGARLQSAAERQSPKDYIAALLDSARSGRTQAVEEAQHLYSLPSAEELKRVTRPESWRKWELAPGVELNVEAGAEKKYRKLIEAIISAAEGR